MGICEGVMEGIFEDSREGKECLGCDVNGNFVGSETEGSIEGLVEEGDKEGCSEGSVNEGDFEGIAEVGSFDGVIEGTLVATVVSTIDVVLIGVEPQTEISNDAI